MSKRPRRQGVYYDTSRHSAAANDLVAEECDVVAEQLAGGADAEAVADANANVQVADANVQDTNVQVANVQVANVQVANVQDVDTYKDASELSITGLTDLAYCPICFMQPMIPPIYTVCNTCTSVNYCSGCSYDLKTCPTCEKPTSLRRERQCEQAIGNMIGKMKCLRNCGANLDNYCDMMTHNKVCPELPHKCPFCNHTTPMKDRMQHMEQYHSANIFPQSGSLTLPGFIVDVFIVYVWIGDCAIELTARRFDCSIICDSPINDIKIIFEQYVEWDQDDYVRSKKTDTLNANVIGGTLYKRELDVRYGVDKKSIPSMIPYKELSVNLAPIK